MKYLIFGLTWVVEPYQSLGLRCLLLGCSSCVLSACPFVVARVWSPWEWIGFDILFVLESTLKGKWMIRDNISRLDIYR